MHDAYLRLVGGNEGSAADEQHWDSRGHFFCAAAEAMRRILIDRAREKHCLKRGGAWRRLHLDQIDLSLAEPPEDLLALDDALTQLATQLQGDARSSCDAPRVGMLVKAVTDLSHVVVP